MIRSCQERITHRGYRDQCQRVGCRVRLFILYPNLSYEIPPQAHDIIHMGKILFLFLMIHWERL